MLVLRKDLKVAIGIGSAVVGVAAVYGLMSLLSGSGADSTTEGDTQTFTLNDGSARGIDTARSGLPPTESEEANAAANIATEPAGPVTGNDPWAEGAGATGTGATGSAADRWTILLSTGGRPVTPAVGHGPVITQVPEVAETNRTSTPSDPVETVRTVSDTPAQPAAGKYVIQPGDTYSAIAGKLYGNRNLYHVIEKANPTLDPRKLRPGMEISVPAVDAVSATRNAVAPQAAGEISAIDQSKQYRVLPGDTLHKISLKLYGQTKRWADIYDLNRQAIGSDAGKIKVGMILQLPQTPTR